MLRVGVERETGDAVSGSDVVVRTEKGYFSVPGALLDAVAAVLVPDRVQISSAADCS